VALLNCSGWAQKAVVYARPRRRINRICPISFLRGSVHPSAPSPTRDDDAPVLDDTARLRDAMRHHMRGDRLVEARRFCAVLTALDPQSAEAALTDGLLRQLHGDPKRAERGFARALTLRPDYAEAWANRSALRLMKGLPTKALADSAIALALAPALPPAHALRARLLYGQNEQEGAVAAAGRALLLGQNRPELPILLVDGLRRLGRIAEAETACRAFLESAPDRADLWSLLGLILTDDHEAAAASGRAVLLDPAKVTPLVNRGNALLRLNQIPQATLAFRAALSVDPGQPEAAFGLASALLDGGHWRAAAVMLATERRRSDAANPSTLWRRIGEAAEAAGERATGLRAFRQATQRSPTDARHRERLARAETAAGRHSRGETLFHTALALDPADSSLLTNSAIAMVDEGRVDEAVRRLRRALIVNPASHKAHSSLLFARQYQPGGNPAERRAEHRAWHDRHAAVPNPAIPSDPPGGVFPNDPAPERPLRIGLVSADLRRHPVGYFVAPFLATHDREQIAVIGYANQTAPHTPDPLTRELMGHAAGWRWIGDLDDAAAAAAIRADAIDILVDLSGHTADHRLPLFAHRPAPIQATWIGYPHSTGMSAIDLIIGGGLEMPETAADWFEERLVALPQGRFCYRPPDEAPPVGPPPALSNGGAITFGSFNSLAKLSVDTVALWARVMAAVPNSRLVLKARPLGDPVVRDRISRRFAAAGVDPQRLDLRGWSSHAALLAEYGEIDIALDPLPFSGGLTSCEALWMGVPMVAWPNDRPAGRQSAHFLNLLGLSDLVVDSADACVEAIAKLCGDLERLTALRAGLRARMRHSPLLDGPSFSRALETAFREEWRRWRRTAST